MKQFLKILAAALAITVVVAFIDIVIYGDSDYSLENIGRAILIDFIFSLSLTAVNSYYYDGLSLRYDWVTDSKKRLWYGAVGSFVLTILTIFILRYLIKYYYTRIGFFEFIEKERPSEYVFSIVITLIAILGLHAFYFYRELQRREVKQQKSIAGSATARFDALKNQLDPHFLFNSLNVLTSLIDEDPDAAQKFTTSLSKVYRYVLEQKNKDLVPVDEELDFARTYVRLLKMRFEDGLDFDIPEKAHNPHAKIVPLSLQLLLENAVKHNVVTSSKPLRLRVFEENGNLLVTNNVQEKKVVRKSSGVGLQNIRQRYSILTEREMEIKESKGQFTVALPMLTQQLEAAHNQTKSEEFLEEKRYANAKEQVDKIKGFYGNLITYAVIIPFLWWLNFRTSSFLWAFFPTIGWGFGVLTHGLEAFGHHPVWGKRWEEKKIRQLMERDDF